MSTDRARLAEFGARLRAARRKHVSKLTDYYIRKIQREIEITGVGKAVFTVDNASGHWSVTDWRAA